jgi:DNA polymerase-1
MARLIKNNHLSYSLDACVRRVHGYDLGKLGVDEYISKHKLYDIVDIPGKLRKEKKKHYYKVPFALMAEYGERDGKLVRDLGVYQVNALKKEDINPNLIENEINLTKVCFHMEQRGIKLDLPYVRDSLKYREEELTKSKLDFFGVSGITYQRGPKCLVEAFTKLGEFIPKTAKGNPCFAKEALSNRDSPIIEVLKRIREHEKFIDTYYSSFINLSDCRGIIRANILQGGTETGRFSYSSPNLQNIPKEDDRRKRNNYYVRKCFVPREGYFFVMIDYNQQEYRLMLDYAGERKIIDKINEGLDVHQATAELLTSPGYEVTRKMAKTINFMLLYGGGTTTLANALQVPFDKAKQLKRVYFDQLPRVTEFLQRVRTTATGRGYIQNWFGRKCHYSQMKGSFIMPNHLIQGGCADIIKVAMVRIHDLLKGRKSSMLVQIHDEILLEVYDSERLLVPKIKEIMENVYRSKNNLRLTCGVEHSNVSFASIDKVKGLPIV